MLVYVIATVTILRDDTMNSAIQVHCNQDRSSSSSSRRRRRSRSRSSSSSSSSSNTAQAILAQVSAQSSKCFQVSPPRSLTGCTHCLSLPSSFFLSSLPLPSPLLLH